MSVYTVVMRQTGKTHIEYTCVIRLKCDDGGGMISQFDAVLRPESTDHLDRIAPEVAVSYDALLGRATVYNEGEG